MPNNVIKSLSSKYDISESELENNWQEATVEARKTGASNENAYAVAVVEKIAKGKGIRKKVTQDSNRELDEDFGYLEVKNCVITGEDIAQYWGREVPNFKELGLDANKIYKAFRPSDEIRDYNFTNKPLLTQHTDFSADDYKHRFIAGTVGETALADDKLTGTVVFWSGEAQKLLDSGLKYLSAGYLYDPVLEKGQYNGEPYDIKMTNIRANHVAMVDNPRYKRAVVADGISIFNVNNLIRSVKKMSFLDKLRNILVTDEDTMSFDEGIEATKKIMCDADLSDEEKEKAIEEIKKKKTTEDKELDRKPIMDEDDDDEGDDKKKDKDKKSTTEDEDDDEDDDKDDKKKTKDKKTTMDADSIERLVAKRVAQEISKFSKTRTVFDSALSDYERICGKANPMAFDSAESVYNAILKNHNYSITNKTLQQKQAMVEMIPSLKHKSQSLTHDNAISGKGKNILPENFYNNKVFN